MQIKNIRSSHHLLTVIICLAILIIVFLEILLNLTPPIDRDALIHHLAIPKLWLKHGIFYEIKWADFSYYPMNVDLLYMIPLFFKMDFMAKFIHMSFGIGTALLIFSYLSKRIGRMAGLVGILVFLSTPMIFRLSTEVYVDLGLIFFTTACIVSFLRYRDGHYNEFKWLFLSALLMGLALGTKTNALPAWLFLSMAFVFLHIRDTGKQWQALKCGLIFVFISLLVFSPWLIKNFFMTGNPFFPFFQGLFNSPISQTPANNYSIGLYKGIFRMREALYGESFWETLLIPIRFFFQGQDNVPRYFDGVLNPIIIILAPFAFIKKSFTREKLLFLGFAVFFILIATFLDRTRIRYILPAIPPLTILSIMGLSYILHWAQCHSKPARSAWLFAFVTVFIAALLPNLFYIKNYYRKYDPIIYISGKISRDAYIAHYDYSYPAMQYINKYTPEKSKIRLIFLARRGYYLDRTYEDDNDLGIGFIRGLVESANNDQTFQNYILYRGYTHLLIRIDLFHRFIQDNYSPDMDKILTRRMSNTLDILYKKDEHAVYRIKASH